MDSCVKCWCLAALLSTLLLHCTEGISEEPINRTSTVTVGTDGDSSRMGPSVHPSLLKMGTLDEERESTQRPRSGGQDIFSKNKTWRETKSKGSQKTLLDFVDTTLSTMEQDKANEPSTSESPGTSVEDKELPICLGCGEETYVEGQLPSTSLPAEFKAGGVESVTSLVWPIRREAGDTEFKKKPSKDGVSIATESQEDSGSGDPHVRMPGSQATHTESLDKQWDMSEFLGKATVSPPQTAITWSKGLLSPHTEKAISPDSAEIDHLLQVSRETVLPPPSGTETQNSRTHVNSEDTSDDRFSPLGGESSRSSAQGVQGQTDITVVTEKPQQSSFSSSHPSLGPLKPSEPPFHPLITEFTDGDYYDPDLDIHGPHEHFPDYPFPDGDIEGDDEDDDDDDDEIEEADDEVPRRELEISRTPKEATLTPKVHTVMVDETPTSQEELPHQTFILFGGGLHPKFHPDIIKDLTQTAPGTSENRTECRNGYVRRNNSCKSLCEIYPTYCYNGGQCYIVENTGVFCRCNTQDYIWHKGMRCESIITDFQVMCVAVGTAALVVLLLFMMTVFFAKKLYLLKTENYKLRKRNRYRTPSELHNDNFSLSTIAEGSHPNEDPNAPQKVQDLPKACLKDEEPFNIQNSLSPKHEGGKGDPDIVDVNCVLNNLT